MTNEDQVVELLIRKIEKLHNKVRELAVCQSCGGNGYNRKYVTEAGGVWCIKKIKCFRCDGLGYNKRHLEI